MALTSIMTSPMKAKGSLMHLTTWSFNAMQIMINDCLKTSQFSSGLFHAPNPAMNAMKPATSSKPPRNLAELQKTAGDDYLFWRINTGKDGTSMIAWKGVLTDEQIWQVITFLHTLK